jgi:hypothetical protein
VAFVACEERDSELDLEQIHCLDHTLSTFDECSARYSSLAGGKPIRIKGANPGMTSEDYKFFIQIEGVSIPAPDGTADFSFLSSPAKGDVYYETPSLVELLGTSLADEYYTADGDLFMEAKSVQYTCLDSSDCRIHYRLNYTPQIFNIYPSTVYEGQNICFEVFSDSTTSGISYNSDADLGEENEYYNTTGKIGQYFMTFDEYFHNNQGWFNTWTYYQL